MHFSFVEKELLLKYALENSHILENRQSNHILWEDKNNCWMHISEKFNSSTTGCFRNAISLRLEYEEIKKLLKGSKSELEKQLYEIVQPSVEGPLESDSVAGSLIFKEKETRNELFSDQCSMIDNETLIVHQINKGINYDNYAGDLAKDTTIGKNAEDNLSNYQSTSNTINNKLVWTSTDFTNFFKSFRKHQNRKSSKLIRTNNCHASVSEQHKSLQKITMEYRKLHISYLREQLKFLRAKRALKESQLARVLKEILNNLKL